MGDVINIKRGATNALHGYYMRVVGTAMREGATGAAILEWLTAKGVQNPERLVAKTKARKVLPQCGSGEIKDLGGRSAVREQFGLDPEAPITHLGRSLLPEDFVAYLPDHTYFFIPTRDLWKAESIAVHVTSPVDGLKVCEWLDQTRHVEQLSWCPGLELFVRDRIVADGGWMPREGLTVLNLYRPPLAHEGGDPAQATRWLEHLSRIYPSDAPHIVQWLAHRVQRPFEKVNHGIVLGGNQRIGKDTILYPVRAAIGEWNCCDVTPSALMGTFNGHVKSVLLRVNETHDLGDLNRYTFYERCKWLLAAPPEVFRVNEKNLREHPVPNVVGVIFTTNYKSNGMFLPPDDARHYVAWSDALREDFDEGYWKEIYQWYETGGLLHVVAYLRQPHLIEGFDPKRPPPRTEAWHEMVNSARSAEETEIADLLDTLSRPDAVTLQDMIENTIGEDSTPALQEFGLWLNERKNRRAIPHKLEACGYVSVRNEGADDGLWKVDGRRQVVYARRELPLVERLRAARRHTEGAVKRKNEGLL